MATITFNNGTTFEAERNGTCFITPEKPDFPKDMSKIQIDGEDGTEILHNAEVIEACSIDGRYWFSFREIPEAEITAAKTDAQVMWTALMTDTLLEEE